MPIDSYYAPPEVPTSPEKTEAKTASVKLAADSTPDPSSKAAPHDYAADSDSLKKLGLLDLQLVDENSPSSKASGSEQPAAEKPPAEKPAAEKPAAEKTPAEKTPAEKTSAEKPAADKTPAEKTPAEKTSAEKPAADKTPAEKTPAEKPAAAKPPSENPGKSEPAEAPKASTSNTSQNSPAATNTDSPKPPEQPAVNKPSSQAGGAKNVIEDVWDGTMNEVDNHPWRLLGDLATGAGIGAGLMVAAATAPVWGTAALVTAAVAGTGYAAYEVDKDMPGWINDVKVADKPSAYTSEEVQQSKAGLNQLGGDIADNTAGLLGGIDGGAFAGGVVSGLTSSVATDATSTADSDAARSLEKTLTDKSDPPTSQPPDQSNPPEQSNPPQQNNPSEQNNPSDNSTPKSGKDGSQPENTQVPSGADVIADSQNPSNYIRQKYGPEGEQAAQAYEMARNLLGKDVQGIAGSYARGAARTGQWPVDNYDDALGLDKMPEDLPSTSAEQLPPEAKALYDLKKQLPTIPSDLDIIASGNSANLIDIEKQIFAATGVLVEFCPA